MLQQVQQAVGGGIVDVGLGSLDIDQGQLFATLVLRAVSYTHLDVYKRQAEDKVKSVQETVEGAEVDLFTAYNNYRWAVDYGILN